MHQKALSNVNLYKFVYSTPNFVSQKPGRMSYIKPIINPVPIISSTPFGSKNQKQFPTARYKFTRKQRSPSIEDNYSFSKHQRGKHGLEGARLFRGAAFHVVNQNSTPARHTVPLAAFRFLITKARGW